MPLDSRTGTFLVTHSNKVSCGGHVVVLAGDARQWPPHGQNSLTSFLTFISCLLPTWGEDFTLSSPQTLRTPNPATALWLIGSPQ